jgi:phenylalanyl-tRNA synthetase alpha chain
MLDPHAIAAEAVAVLGDIDDPTTLEDVKARYLGKSGSLTELMKQLGKLDAADRPAAGAKINEAKQQVEAALNAQREIIANRALEKKLSAEALDVTLPGRGLHAGGLHPVSRTLNRITDLFHSIGFDVADGPEIESDHYNFTALNIPANHPARAMHDTFYVGTNDVLRTHTSPMQVRYLESHSLPVKVIVPGRVYRCDSDQTHTPMFHQVEGLVLDENIGFAHLKAILRRFVSAFFEKPLEIRLRPSYFPFTEPSAEVDCQCAFCEGKGCRICKHTALTAPRTGSTPP